MYLVILSRIANVRTQVLIKGSGAPKGSLVFFTAEHEVLPNRGRSRHAIQPTWYIGTCD